MEADARMVRGAAGAEGRDGNCAMNMQSSSMPVVLTVAGSDSGAGAGIQADIKTFEALGVGGVCAVTCVTAQTPGRVTGVEPVSCTLISEQIDAVCRDFPVAVAKIGMLHSAAIVETVADCVERVRAPLWVLDPVMISTSGARLLQHDAVESLRERLLPAVDVVTPNIPEAEELWGHPVDSVEKMAVAAREIGRRHSVSCVVKGGHLCATSAALDGSPRVIADALWDGSQVRFFKSPAVQARETHGTGCTFSAALAAGLARGEKLPQAARQAQSFVAKALAYARPVGKHLPLGWARASVELRLVNDVLDKQQAPGPRHK